MVSEKNFTYSSDNVPICLKKIKYEIVLPLILLHLEYRVCF